MKCYAFLVLFALFTVGVASATPYQTGSFDPVRPNPDYWTCYDYAIDYARDHPEYGIVTVSTNPCFKGISHMLNYKVENGTIHFYDPTWTANNNQTYEYYVNVDTRKIENPYFEICYYKFWSVNQTPLRNYRSLQDNSEEWLNV